MPIYYALLAKHTDTALVLAEYTPYQGNFQKIAREIMGRIQDNTMKTFELEDFFFHYINENGLSAMCMTDKTFERKLTFAFLQDLKQSLLNVYTPRDLQNAGQNSLQTFNTTIQEKIVSPIFCLTLYIGVLELKTCRLWRQNGPIGKLA